MKVADMHCDTILAIQRGREQGKEISLRKNNLNLDLERMKKGDYLIQNFALFLDLEDPMLAGSPKTGSGRSQSMTRLKKIGRMERCRRC